MDANILPTKKIHSCLRNDYPANPLVDSKLDFRLT
jgi:hypothetical protein